MADERVLIKESTLTAMGNSIRAKTGKAELINPDNMPAEIDGISSGSSTPVDNGPIYEGKYRVRYFDIDGTLIKVDYVESGGKTTPPDAPSYDPNYLIFAEWNYDTDNYIVEQPTDIGAIYDTVNDATYMFCTFAPYTGLNPTINITGYTSIDWGDGTIDTNNSHTYAKEGKYLIKINGNMQLTNDGLSYKLLTTKSALTKIYIATQAATTIAYYLFSSYNNLKIISLPKTITKINNNFCSMCYSLKNINIPKNVTAIDVVGFAQCYDLKTISTQYKDNRFESDMFKECYNLEEIIIPKNVKYVGSNVLSNCITLKNVFILSSSVPTTRNAQIISYPNELLVIWVNDDIINQLKVATNWSNLASYMKPLSWYPSLTNPNV